jgi:signal transduction histidine kinase
MSFPRRQLRRALLIRSLLTSALIVVSFSVPLALLIRVQAKERALTFARSDARALAPVVSIAGSPNVTSSIYAVAQRALPRVVTVVFSDFTILGANEVVEPDPYDDPVALRRAQKVKAFTVPAKGGLVVYEPVPRSNNTTAVVRVWVPNSQLSRGVGRAWLELGVLGLGLVLLAGFVADRLGRSLVRSVNALAESANRLGRGDVSERVIPNGPAEIQQVGAALNNLAERIDELLITERVAVADLQHRLRTPVTALRAEVGTLREPSMAPAAQRLEAGLEELTKTKYWQKTRAARLSLLLTLRAHVAWPLWNRISPRLLTCCSTTFFLTLLIVSVSSSLFLRWETSCAYLSTMTVTACRSTTNPHVEHLRAGRRVWVSTSCGGS